MVEEHADRDLVSVRNDAGQPTLDGVAESQLALADELQDDGCDVCLGQARDAVVVTLRDLSLRGEVGNSADEPRRLAAVANEQDCSRGSGGYQRVDILLEVGRIRLDGLGHRTCREDASQRRQGSEDGGQERRRSNSARS